MHRPLGEFFCLIAFFMPFAAQASNSDWPNYGNDEAGTRYAPLDQITPANVAQLTPAWSYRLAMPSNDIKNADVGFEVTPLKVDDAVYFCTPYNTLIALDAQTGKERWKFDPKIKLSGFFRVCRGVAYYRAPQDVRDCPERILTATIDARLIAVDARTGKPCLGFGGTARSIFSPTWVG